MKVPSQLSPIKEEKDENITPVEKPVKSEISQEKPSVNVERPVNGDINDKHVLNSDPLKAQPRDHLEPKKEQMDNRLEQDAIMALLQMRNEIMPPASKASPAPAPLVTPIIKPTPSAPPPPRPQTPPHIRELRRVQQELALEHNYYTPMKTPEKKRRSSKKVEAEMTDSASEGEAELQPCLPHMILMDHNYCHPYFPSEAQPKEARVSGPEATNATPSRINTSMETPSDVHVAASPVKETKRRYTKKQLNDVTNLQGSRELANLLPPPMKPRLKFSLRSYKEEFEIMYDFLLGGIDQEDANFLKRRYEELLQDDSPQTYWLNDTHWVDHTHTKIPDPIPPKKKRKVTKDETLTIHKTGNMSFNVSCHYIHRLIANVFYSL